MLKGELEELIEAIEKEGITVIYLEDVAKKVSVFNKISGLMKSYMSQAFYKAPHSDDAAVIVFPLYFRIDLR